MKCILRGSVAFTTRRLPDLAAAVVAVLVFWVASEPFIAEKSTIARLVATGTGLAGGLVGGGLLGWVVGGVGVVAMGTGIGVGVLGAALIGGAVGAVFGGLTGTTFTFVQMLRNPGRYDVDWVGLGLVLAGSIVVFIVTAFLFRRLPGLFRRNRTESE